MSRAVMQQALEALETCSEDEWHSDDDFGMMQVYDEAKVTQAITALRQALAEPEQPPEALGYVPLSDDGTHVFIDGIGLVPLAHYAPTPRKPLTREQLRGIREHQRLLEELGPVWAPMLYYFCQSIERAHGITGETK